MRRWCPLLVLAVLFLPPWSMAKAEALAIAEAQDEDQEEIYVKHDEDEWEHARRYSLGLGFNLHFGFGGEISRSLGLFGVGRVDSSRTATPSRYSSTAASVSTSRIARTSMAVYQAGLVLSCDSAAAARLCSSYTSIGSQAHTRLRSPHVLSIRLTDGQNFLARTHGAGNAARSRL